MALGVGEAVLMWRGHGTHGMGGLTSYIVITDRGKLYNVLTKKAFYWARVYTLCFLNCIQQYMYHKFSCIFLYKQPVDEYVPLSLLV